jgi:hypothetical protein
MSKDSNDAFRESVAGVFALLFGIPGFLALIYSLLQVFQAIEKWLPWKRSSVGPLPSAEVTLSIGIMGVFFLLLAVSAVIHGRTPQGGGPGYPHSKKFRDAAEARMMSAQLTFLIPGGLLIITGIGLTLFLHFWGLAMILGGLDSSFSRK